MFKLILLPLDLVALACAAAGGLFSRTLPWRMPLGTFLMQIYFTAVQAVAVVSIAALLLGGVLQIGLIVGLSKWLSEEYLVRLTLFTLVQEVAPLMVMLIVVGRSGTAIATELAAQKINREIDLLDTLGIDPRAYLLLPRLAAGPLSVLGLTVYFAVVAVVGGYFLMRVVSGEAGYNLLNLISALHAADLAVLALKAALFGFIIAGVSCLEGLEVKKSVTEVPRAATSAFVNSVILCLLVEAGISLLSKGV